MCYEARRVWHSATFSMTISSRSFVRHQSASAETLHDLAQPIVWEGIDAVIIATGHGVVVDQRIYDRFFGGLHDAAEERVHEIVGNRLHVMRHLIRTRDVRIRS